MNTSGKPSAGGWSWFIVFLLTLASVIVGIALREGLIGDNPWIVARLITAAFLLLGWATVKNLNRELQPLAAHSARGFLLVMCVSPLFYYDDSPFSLFSGSSAEVMKHLLGLTSIFYVGTLLSLALNREPRVAERLICGPVSFLLLVMAVGGLLVQVLTGISVWPPVTAEVYFVIFWLGATWWFVWRKDEDTHAS